VFSNVLTTSGAQSPFYSVVTQVLFWGEKQTWYKANHLPASTAGVRNEWSYTSTPPIFPHGIDRDFTCTLLLQIIVRNCKVHFSKCFSLQDGLTITTN